MKSNRKIILILFLVAVVSSFIFVFVFKNNHHPSSHSQASVKGKALYQCPMHPSVTSDRPGNCPICGMRLQKVLEEEANQSAETGAVGGRSSFSLSQERQQLIGVTTTQVSTRLLSRDIRATGRVAFDPDLFTAIEEYRQTVLARSKMEQSAHDEFKKLSDELLEATKTKLKLMGLSEAQIQRFSAQRSHSMDLLLPTGQVWIYAEVFEYEVWGINSGQKIEVESPAVPGRVFVGQVSSISPILNSDTRTVRVRAEVPNPERILKPDMFVNVKIKVDLGKKIVVPHDAILHSSDKDFVFVVKEKGRFEPKGVRIGYRGDDYCEILSGLEEGETIVTAANFLIDSESRMRAALQHMSRDKK